MCFEWQGWGVVRPWASGFTVWSYRTGDTINQIMAEGYFDALVDLGAVDIEDWIIGHAAFERPLELIICDRTPHIKVEPLHDWFERTCAARPVTMH